jgi:hypothetical protein
MQSFYGDLNRNSRIRIMRIRLWLLTAPPVSGGGLAYAFLADDL